MLSFNAVKNLFEPITESNGHHVICKKVLYPLWSTAQPALLFCCFKFDIEDILEWNLNDYWPNKKIQ
jgi:hypothetical protein